MRIGGLQRFSLIDFPGCIAAVVFTQGCSLRCGFCHNPELVIPKLYADCVPEERVIAFLDGRRGQLDGVAVTGGEPTDQPELIPFVRCVREMGFRTKLDTNGTRPQVLRKLIRERLVDYVAMDVKAPLEKYPAVTGVPVDTTLIAESIALLKRGDVDYEFRTTVVNGHIGPADVAALGRLLQGARRYVLQMFVAGKHVDAHFASVRPYTSMALELMARQLREYVQVCDVR